MATRHLAGAVEDPRADGDDETRRLVAPGLDFAAAQQALHTETKKDTVNAALTASANVSVTTSAP